MGIANIINTAGGGGGGSEIITNLVNSVDGAGLRLANQGYISCAHVSANKFGTNDFSVEFVLSQETAILNADIFTSNLNGSNQAVDAAVIRWDVIQNDNIQLVFTNSGATETAYNFGYDPAPDLNEPTHYLVSADRTGNAVLYRNGAEIASISIAASGSANVGNSGQPTVIGSPVNNFGVKGNVYRLRTYSKALSSDEAKNVFDRADVPTALVSNLLLDLDFAYANPTQSTVIQDKGPNNQDGTLNGTITQTNVIKQLNSTSARIGTTQANPADGEIIANSLKSTDGASGATANSTANSLVIDSNSSQAGLSILSPTNGQGNVFFGDSDDDNVGRIEYSHSANSMEFRTAGSTALTIDSSGHILLPLGQTIKTDFSSGGTTRTSTIEMFNNSTGALSLKTVNSATGGVEFWTEGTKRLDVTRGGLCIFSSGIAFQSATTGSGTGVGYTLENYEYGTFTMGLSGTTATIPSGYETARYYRIGNLVWISWYSGAMTLASSSGTAQLTGLPFNNANNKSNSTPFSYTHGNAVDGNSRGGYIVKNANYMQFIDDGSAATATFIDGTNNRYIMITAVYETDDA